MLELIESRFFANKSEVVDRTISPYNELVYDKMLEISYYQGFLDSSSVTEFVNNNFSAYSFIKSIYFFDLEVGNHHIDDGLQVDGFSAGITDIFRSEEHTSELQSLMRISYAVFCLKKKKSNTDKR